MKLTKEFLRQEMMNIEKLLGVSHHLNKVSHHFGLINLMSKVPLSNLKSTTVEFAIQIFILETMIWAEPCSHWFQVTNSSVLSLKLEEMLKKLKSETKLELAALLILALIVKLVMKVKNSTVNMVCNILIILCMDS